MAVLLIHIYRLNVYNVKEPEGHWEERAQLEREIESPGENVPYLAVKRQDVVSGSITSTGTPTSTPTGDSGDDAGSPTGPSSFAPTENRHHHHSHHHHSGEHHSGDHNKGMHSHTREKGERHRTGTMLKRPHTKTHTRKHHSRPTPTSSKS